MSDQRPLSTVGNFRACKKLMCSQRTAFAGTPSGFVTSSRRRRKVQEKVKLRSQVFSLFLFFSSGCISLWDLSSMAGDRSWVPAVRV